jgi:hypothetical protein
MRGQSLEGLAGRKTLNYENGLRIEIVMVQYW